MRERDGIALILNISELQVQSPERWTEQLFPAAQVRCPATAPCRIHWDYPDWSLGKDKAVVIIFLLHWAVAVMLGTCHLRCILLWWVELHSDLSSYFKLSHWSILVPDSNCSQWAKVFTNFLMILILWSPLWHKKPRARRFGLHHLIEKDS